MTPATAPTSFQAPGARELPPASPRLLVEPQPGDRKPAPGDLGLVQAFANSFHDLRRRRAELFRTPAALAAWLRARGLLERDVVLTADDRQRAIDAREGIRAMLFDNNGCEFDPAAVERLNLVLRRGGVVPQLHPQHHPSFLAPRRDLDGALTVIAAIVAAAQLQGQFQRLKACPGPDCGWAFYDHSRNQASAWCSMSICGARVKARSYRTRKRLSRPDR